MTQPNINYTPQGLPREAIIPEVLERIRMRRTIDSSHNCPLYATGTCFSDGYKCDKKFKTECDKYWREASRR